MLASSFILQHAESSFLHVVHGCCCNGFVSVADATGCGVRADRQPQAGDARAEGHIDPEVHQSLLKPGMFLPGLQLPNRKTHLWGRACGS